jgi:hypothetical protein
LADASTPAGGRLPVGRRLGVIMVREMFGPGAMLADLDVRPASPVDSSPERGAAMRPAPRLLLATTTPNAQHGGRYLPLQDDIAPVACWYQAEPHAPFPALPNRVALEIQCAG